MDTKSESSKSSVSSVSSESTVYTDTNLLSHAELETALEKVNNMDSAYTLLEYVYSLLPQWINERTEHYADEYRILEENWGRLCAQWHTTPQAILIVEYLPAQQDFTNHQLLATFCNRLTHFGFVIRNKTELTVCGICRKALLTEKVFQYLSQNHSDKIPASWSPTCIQCKSQA